MMKSFRNSIVRVFRYFGGLFSIFNLWNRVSSSKIALGLGLERAYKFVEETLNLDPPDAEDLQQWGICTLADRKLLPGGYFRYRFELDGVNSILPLEMGQELIMCSSDDAGTVLKEPFFPISIPDARGHFDILTKRGGESSSDRFATALEHLSIGDEMAFKGGRFRMNYLGSSYPIEGLSIISSGTGATAALQILRNVLPGDKTTINNVDMMWVNEDKSDFVCDSDVEKLENRYMGKFTLYRVIESDLYGPGFSKRQDVKNYLPPYKKGRLGVIIAPEYVISKARNLLKDLGYPVEEIVTIITAI